MACSVSSVRRTRGGVLCAIRRRRSVRLWFRAWARRLAAALLLSAAAPLFTVPLQAQAPNRIMTCVRDAPETVAFRSGGDFAPDRDPTEGAAMIPPTSMVRAAVTCAEQFANTTMVPIGLNLFRFLAIIITIWTGIQMMFSGGFAIGEVVSLILLLGFPFAVLSFYAATVLTPWGNLSFTRMVSGMGETIGTELVDGVFAEINTTVSDAWRKIWGARVVEDALDAAGGRTGVNRFVIDGMLGISVPFVGNVSMADDPLAQIRRLGQAVQMVVVLGLLGAVLLIPIAVAYCSYLWGYLSLMVAIILGPILIPWMLVPQMQFLAWGWFRSVVAAGIHMMVAGAAFAVAGQIMLIPLVRFSTMMGDPENADAFSLTSLLSLSGSGAVAVIVESLPLIVVACLGVFKIGEITSMIMNGGSMPQSGIGDRMNSMGRLRGMGSSGRALVGGGAGGGVTALAGATPAGKAAVVAGAVLSQSTKK